VPAVKYLYLSPVHRPEKSPFHRFEKSPNHRSAVTGFLLALGRPQQAKKGYERLLEIEPESHDGRYGPGRAFLSLNENDNARASLEKARSLDPESTSVLASLAVGEKAEGNQRRAGPCEQS
jgi:tetratricopeptide (TPR) repeat protein